MKITNVSCTQFAGVRDRSLVLTDGINVICGKNESGKSTLVNLISRTLFQNAKLDRRSDKFFLENYFPTAKKGNSHHVEFADGTVTLSVGEDTYTVKKEWGDDSRASLAAPDGIVRGDANVAGILRNVLCYGEGVYKDILFSSQSDVYPALQTILDASKKTDAKQDITDAVSRAFAESDGISLDAVEQKINDRIGEISGEHWDLDRKAPKRGRSERWSKGLGEILKAYYALEDAKAVLTDISGLESAADAADAEFSEKDADYNAAEAAYRRFSGVSTALTLQSERKKSAERISSELEKLTGIFSVWPVLCENVRKAKSLEAEAAARVAFELYHAAQEKQAELDALQTKAAKLLCPEDKEISAVKSAQRKIMALENKLCGMNLTASIRMFGEHRVELRSLLTGEAIDPNAAAHITEAVSITVPGVMEMCLAPANVDVADVEAQLRQYRAVISDTFGKYGVSAEDELETLKSDYTGLQNEIADRKKELCSLLDGRSFEEIRAEAPAAVRSREDIAADITKLCGAENLSRYIISGETTLSTYESSYSDAEGLRQRIDALRSELKKTMESLSEAANIPEEYCGITDPAGYLDLLKSDSEDKKELREKALRKKFDAEAALENYRSTASDDPTADVEKAERAFREQEELLAHWMHIAEVFAARKKALSCSPLVGLAEDFARYLGIISGDRISSEFPETDKLSMNLYSAERAVDYGKLSEGSKETVSLAFRLAVLDHLFPDGGGIIVLDDPFANMDPERTKQAIELIKDCAKRHQVIFLTCKEEYPPLLNGNLIRL